MTFLNTDLLVVVKRIQMHLQVRNATLSKNKTMLTCLLNDL